jgi:hypothetical protein
MKRSIIELAKIIAIVRGLVTIVSSLLPLNLLGVVLVLIIVILSSHLKYLLWSVVILIMGLLAYRFGGDGFLLSLGPILVVLAGVLCIATKII